MQVNKEQRSRISSGLEGINNQLETKAEESEKTAIAEKETLIKEIEANHIILNNPSPYINMMWEYYGK